MKRPPSSNTELDGFSACFKDVSSVTLAPTSKQADVKGFSFLIGFDRDRKAIEKTNIELVSIQSCSQLGLPEARDFTTQLRLEQSTRQETKQLSCLTVSFEDESLNLV